MQALSTIRILLCFILQLVLLDFNDSWITSDNHLRRKVQLKYDLVINSAWPKYFRRWSSPICFKSIIAGMSTACLIILAINFLPLLLVPFACIFWIQQQGRSAALWTLLTMNSSATSRYTYASATLEAWFIFLSNWLCSLRTYPWTPITSADKKNKTLHQNKTYERNLPPIT